jgi:mannose-6-phosphate isomerase-like protein (cupin superfamily)
MWDKPARETAMICKEMIPHRPWGDGCRSWDLLDKEDLIVVAESMPAGTSEQRHFHSKARQFFFVLEGELRIDTNDRCEVLKRGDGLEIEPGHSHRVFNASAEVVEFLAIASPSTKRDRTNG